MVKYLAAAAAFFAPAIVWAQDVVADAPVSSGWDTAFTLYAIGGSLLVGGITFALKKLADYLGVKIDNETVGGIMKRLIGSISDAVAMVDQTIRKEIEAAKDPASPGGAKITESEKQKMRDAVWEALKQEYGGWDGIFGLVKRIGIGDATAAKAKVNTMIEAAVNAHNLKKKATEGQGPQ